MSTIEELTTERDALKTQNEALTAQAKQLICDLAKEKQLSVDLARQRTEGGRKSNVFGGVGGAGAVSRNVFEAMSPGARSMFVKAGGQVTD